MRILVDIHHPKHVHFFRPLIRRWQARGDAVQIVTRDKDITHRLLDLYELPYTCLSRQARGGGPSSSWPTVGYASPGRSGAFVQT